MVSEKRIVVLGHAKRKVRGNVRRLPLAVIVTRKKRDVTKAIRWARHWKVPLRMCRSGSRRGKRVSLIDGGILISFRRKLHRKGICRDSRILNQPIGPSPDRLIGQETTAVCTGGLTDVPGI
ncbi:hypothetical protein [Paenibacillus thiaminolyticus]|uniref:hypothetical protein n=1 Tax=Paenibacillus thiaminolyticus TaxID=49283 RepID=UPI00254370E2|nr:hypothetical protein [Paenibacillus thiaminolyticus]WII36059.1 hypothetical protein O0V01_20575 [Paenibacillus thiaminolyticus]